MHFKQIQIFELSKSSVFSVDELCNKLTDLAFTACLPSMPDSAGWVPPVEEDEADVLVRGMNGNLAFCLQVEEKILPATVIRKEVSDAVKEIETSEGRKLRQKEKLDLKDQITLNMLPRAFSKLTRVYAYIDNKNHWLILGTSSSKLTDKFLSIFKKSVTDDVFAPQLVKPAYIMTNWLKNQSYPSTFAVEDACMLQDPNKEGRVIRCKQQDLFANSIQALLNDGCEVQQLALSWQDRLNFVLVNDFSIRSIQLADELLENIKEFEAETKQQQFDADLMIISGTIDGLITDLLELFSEKANKKSLTEHAEDAASMLKTA